jgi:hypothetical protein
MAKAKTKTAQQKADISLALDRMATRITDIDRYAGQLFKKIEKLEGEVEVKFAAITQVSDLFTTLRKVLQQASTELAGAASYTQQEISRMSADEYRDKVLVPLNMGRRV